MTDGQQPAVHAADLPGHLGTRYPPEFDAPCATQ